MAFEIGHTIKRLRKERSLTQEELAEQLNVTAQAVSKWENGTGMPDISQIVPLAGVFGVSTDVLFGISGTNDDEEVHNIIAAVSEPRRSAHYENDAEYDIALQADYDTLLLALQRYPKNTLLLQECLGAGTNLAIDYHRANDNRAGELFTESVRQARLIISYSKDAAAVMSAHMWLVRLYSAFGDYKSAMEHAYALPDGAEQNRGAMLAWIKREEGDTDGELQQRCNNISLLLYELYIQIALLGNAYRVKEQYEDAIRVYISIFGIIGTIYGREEYTPPLHTLAWVHQNIARCYVKLGDTGSAVQWLNDYVDFCLAQGRYYNKRKQVETPLLRKCVYEFFAAEYHSARKSSLLEDLAREAFDPIREDARFKVLLDRLNALEA
jgi:transcriptional regulator with XRE-family HTH domain